MLYLTMLLLEEFTEFGISMIPFFFFSYFDFNNVGIVYC
jgi:hypothetical protein